MVDEAASYPGAVGPARSYDFRSRGFRLRLHEWGDPAADAIVLCHGMWDHGRGFDLLAPLLSDHYRLVAIDQRGHGDSEWADSYSWPHDVTDVLAVIEHLGRAHVLGHSKGGGQATDAALLLPQRIGKLINIDGFGPPDKMEPPPGMPLEAEPGSPGGFAAFLDARRRSHTRPDWKPYAGVDDLIARRKQMNPRLSEPWLRYFCHHGARHGDDGVRWKVDPMAGMGAGPFKPEWIAPSWRGLRVPMLAIVGAEQDTWGPIEPELLAHRLSHVPELRRETVADAGHFVHMEQPAAVAELVLDFLRGHRWS